MNNNSFQDKISILGKSLLFGIVPIIVLKVYEISLEHAITKGEKIFSEGSGSPYTFFLWAGLVVGLIYFAEKPILGKVCISIFSVIILVFIIGMTIKSINLSEHGPTPVLSAEECKSLVKIEKNKEIYFYHPIIGFSFLSPGENFKTIPQQLIKESEAFQPEKGDIIYVYANPDRGPCILAISVSKFNKIEKKGFKDFVAGIEKGFRSMVDSDSLGDQDFKIIDDQWIWENKRKECHKHFFIREKIHFLLSAWSHCKGNGKCYIIALFGFSTDAADLLKSIQSFSFSRT